MEITGLWFRRVFMKMLYIINHILTQGIIYQKRYLQPKKFRKSPVHIMFALPRFITIDLENAVSTHHGCSFFRDVETSPGPATGSTTGKSIWLTVVTLLMKALRFNAFYFYLSVFIYYTAMIAFDLKWWNNKNWRSKPSQLSRAVEEGTTTSAVFYQTPSINSAS